jgi:hypothetical protein
MDALIEWLNLISASAAPVNIGANVYPTICPLFELSHRLGCGSRRGKRCHKGDRAEDSLGEHVVNEREVLE